MNKRVRNIILMLAVLAVAIGANIIINFVLKVSDEIVDETQNLYISNYSVGSVTKVEIENENGTLVLLSNDGIWQAEGREDAALDQGVVSEIVYMLTHIVGERIVSDNEDETNLYGMLTPSAEITTQHNGVLEQTFIIGDKAPVENEYYMQSSVYKRVYTVDMAYYIYGQITLEDLLELKGVEAAHEDMHKMHIINAEGDEYTIQRTADDNNISLCYWEFAAPFNHDMDTAVLYGTDKYEGMITYIIELSGESVVGYADTDAQSYGQDSPIYTVEIFSESDFVQSFSIGDYGDEENYSLTFSDDNNIYTIEKERVLFINYSAYMLADSNLNLINIDVVDALDINLPDIDMSLEFVHNNYTDANGNIIAGVEINIAGVDESKINTPGFDDQKLVFYQNLVTIKIDDLFLNYDDTGEKIGEINFRLNSKYRDMYIVEFYEYSQTHYLVKKNSEDAGYLVNKKQVENLVHSYELLLEGKLKSTH